MPTSLPDKTKKSMPLFRRIEDDLRRRIEEGLWQSGEALPSRSRLCEEFGTTRVTLDKAIQELVRSGLLHSTKGSGTFVLRSGPPVPQSAPRSLRLGIVLEGTTANTMPEGSWNDNFYFGPLFQGIRDGILGQPVEVLYEHLDRSDYNRFYHSSGLDGMVLIAHSREDLPVLRRLGLEGIAFVATGISSPLPEDSALPCVDTNNVGGACEAMRHLVGLGHRHIALVNLATTNSNHFDRLEGYRRTLAVAGLTAAPENMVLFPTHGSGQFEDQIEEWLLRAQAEGRVPTAIFACDYLMALATLRVLRRHNLRVPDDISLISFDDPLSAAHLTPPLTTVRQPVYHLGRRSAQRLIQALQDGTRPQGLEILPTELIIRDSTRRLPAASATERALVTS